MDRLNRRCNFVNTIRFKKVKSLHNWQEMFDLYECYYVDFAERGLSKRALITYSHAVMNDVAER